MSMKTQFSKLFHLLYTLNMPFSFPPEQHFDFNETLVVPIVENKSTEDEIQVCYFILYRSFRACAVRTALVK